MAAWTKHLISCSFQKRLQAADYPPTLTKLSPVSQPDDPKRPDANIWPLCFRPEQFHFQEAVRGADCVFLLCVFAVCVFVVCV